MRVKIRFVSENKLTLPLHYNYLVQSFIYRNIGKTLSQFLHKKGFTDGKRNFKGFTFSRLLSRERKVYSKEGKIVINPPFELVISSPVNRFIESLAEVMLRKESLHLGENKVYFDAINVYAQPKLGEKVQVKMLSPMTVYSTLSKLDGRKKTYYYSPFEREFSELIEKNLRKKHRAYFGKDSDGDFTIKPSKVSRRDEKIIIYKGTVVKGWMGFYELSGSSELLKLAYDAGIGSKNSQGFGCFELLETEAK